ncbi:MAG: amidohydrolase family protein [Deltaproteobacteria bacterium]|nr:amidohydrolase family protein [Deltaproteobacteria bacterium]
MESGTPLLLKDGFVVDGTGQKGYTGNLLIKGEKIKQISRAPIDIQCETIDCTGLVIAPGFIDAHSHMERYLALEGSEKLKTPFTAQGCTTFVTGNCGTSAAGFKKNTEFKHLIEAESHNIINMYWDSMAEYFSHLNKVGLSHNVVTLAGHGITQLSIRGLNPNPLDGDELKELHALLEEAMDQGAAGVSFGLGYEPGMFFPLDEIKKIACLVKKKDKILSVHGRVYAFLSGFYDKSDPTPHNVLSLQEMIDVAKETGVRMQYSHMILTGTKTHPTCEQCLDVIDQAIAEGVDIMTDTFPYHCGPSIINIMLPAWFLADIPANYSNKEALARAGHGLDNMPRNIGLGYEDIQLMNADSARFSSYQGLFIDEIADKLRIKPSRVILELSKITDGKAPILTHQYSSMKNIEDLIRHPACLFMTDSLVSAEGFQNPGSFGAFPLFLQYARDRNLLSLEKAVHKMTGATAERFNIRDRGTLKEGLAADITVFDWENVRDNNSIKETDRAPTGIERVFINGRQVKKDGQVDVSIKAGVILT